jgi:hypothetical protein
VAIDWQAIGPARQQTSLQVGVGLDAAFVAARSVAIEGSMPDHIVHTNTALRLSLKRSGGAIRVLQLGSWETRHGDQEKAVSRSCGKKAGRAETRRCETGGAKKVISCHAAARHRAPKHS